MNGPTGWNVRYRSGSITMTLPVTGGDHIDREIEAKHLAYSLHMRGFNFVEVWRSGVKQEIDVTQGMKPEEFATVS